MVPEGWKRVPLATIAEVRSGVAKGKSGLKDPITVPYLRVANVQDGYINLDDVKEIEIERHQLERYSLKFGDVLMNEGGDFDKLGRGDVWLDQIVPCLHQNHVFAVRPMHQKVDSFFLAALAASNYGKKYFLSCAKRSTNLASVNSTQIKEFPILVPPLVEQKKITQIISTWEKSIVTTEKMLALVRRQKKSLMQKLLTGKCRLPGFSERWRQGTLGELCDFKGGSAFKESFQGNKFGDIPFIKVSDMNLFGNEMLITNSNNWVSLDTAKLMKAKCFSKGTIVFAKVGAALLLNRRRILTRDTIIDNNMMAAIPNELVDSLYLYQLMLAIDFAKFVQDGAVPSINQRDLSVFKISYPQLDEQKRIASVLSVADKQIEVIQQKLEYLRKEKKAVMQQLLTGKRRVKTEVT